MSVYSVIYIYILLITILMCSNYGGISLHSKIKYNPYYAKSVFFSKRVYPFVNYKIRILGANLSVKFGSYLWGISQLQIL